MTKEEKIQKEIEKLVKQGLPETEAVKEVERRELKRKGLARCHFCGDIIDLEHSVGINAAVRELGIWYHLGCLNDRKAWEEKIAARTPMTREGIEIKCAYCGEPILMSHDWWWLCPEGCDSRYSSRCKYFHNFDEPPLDCWFKYYAEMKKKKGK